MGALRNLFGANSPLLNLINSMRWRAIIASWRMAGQPARPGWATAGGRRVRRGDLRWVYECACIPAHIPDTARCGPQSGCRVQRWTRWRERVCTRDKRRARKRWLVARVYEAQTCGCNACLHAKGGRVSRTWREWGAWRPFGISKSWGGTMQIAPTRSD